ncbi:hypothetical protein P7K49_020683 [Saguinus oedipus]|uniref:Uncharacterized protein n=1 Tax=Saguinus oedipus TaxID=9490 RepID=A0ABQ9V0Y3_SAGOE|nr:hypothetical protein P7K49_020683 [Saguinus oedipus]
MAGGHEAKARRPGLLPEGTWLVRVATVLSLKLPLRPGRGAVAEQGHPAPPRMPLSSQADLVKPTYRRSSTKGRCRGSWWLLGGEALTDAGPILGSGGDPHLPPSPHRSLGLSVSWLTSGRWKSRVVAGGDPTLGFLQGWSRHRQGSMEWLPYSEGELQRTGADLPGPVAGLEPLPGPPSP